MENKNHILNMYFVEHKQQVEIATAVGVSQQYVSKVVKADNRYNKEKQQRQDQHQQQRQFKQRQYIKNKREQEIREYEYLKYLQKCNSKEMSKHYLTNSPTLSKWEKAYYGIN